MKISSLITAIAVAASLTAKAQTRDYENLNWRPVGAATILPLQTVEIPASGFRGQFLRVAIPASCGWVNFGLDAAGRPFAPRVIFDRNATVRNPDVQKFYFWLRQERNLDFEKIWLYVYDVPTGTCQATVDVAEGHEPDPNDQNLPRVFAEAQSSSDVAEYVAVDLAWDRTISRAQELCRSANVRKVSGQGSCSARGRGNHWAAECHAWFYCLP